jgi:hypothetical protein
MLVTFLTFLWCISILPADVESVKAEHKAIFNIANKIIPSVSTMNARTCQGGVKFLLTYYGCPPCLPVAMERLTHDTSILTS